MSKYLFPPPSTRTAACHVTPCVCHVTCKCNKSFSIGVLWNMPFLNDLKYHLMHALFIYCDLWELLRN